MDVDRITVEQVQDWSDADKEVVFLDARNPQDWESAQGKIPGALRARTDLEVEGIFQKVPKDRTVVTYCT